MSTTLTVEIHSHRNGRFAVIFNGELLIKNSRDPEHDAARALLARGITGKVVTIDPATGMRRMTIGIERYAGRSVVEDDSGLRTRPWRPFPADGVARELPGGAGRSQTPANDERASTGAPHHGSAGETVAV